MEATIIIDCAKNLLRVFRATIATTMMSTLTDVAHRAGVSLSTASRVISNSEYGVTDELRHRVLNAAVELNYVPNATARALATNLTSTLGVVVGDVGDPYFSEILRGVQWVASETGHLVIICNSYREPEQELSYVRLLHAQRVDAIILAGSGLEDHEYSQRMSTQLETFVGYGGRVSHIGRHQHLVGNGVVPDNFGGAKEMGRVLIERGHRRFGVISGPPMLTTTHDRLAGFRQALDEAGIALSSTQVVQCSPSRDGGAEAMLEIMSRLPDTTAVFAMADQMAIGALAVLAEQGVCVPNEISVAGFNDIPVARDLTPGLSTVRLPLVLMGARATQLVLKPEDSRFRTEHLSAEVILRESVNTLRSW